MEKAEIAAKIAELKADKAKAKGTPCEVFSRVVGYLRPVQNWNDGKKEEYKLRKHFTCGCGGKFLKRIIKQNVRNRICEANKKEAH